ncbi:hypothetical protein AYO38_09350 [bacterium SCGC AG-212-C10]|nr:hypothetical protein AYO38_09350 [bacterium SCGC AG-212-C10]
MTTATALTGRVVEFCRLLREQDLPVSPGASLDAARSLELVDVADAPAFHAALRANLTTSVDQYRAFNAAFAAYWGDLFLDAPETVEIPDLQPTIDGPPRPPEVVYALLPVELEGVSGDGESILPGGDRTANEVDLLTHKDFADFTPDDVVRARRIIRKLTPALATVPSRRYRPSPSGGHVDLRRTVRSAQRSGGEVVHIEQRRRKLRKLRVVALCDVSGSMDIYSHWLLQFLYALQNEAGAVRTFVFSTRVHDVTALLKRKRYEDAVAAISGTVDTWSGGTTIGACLGEFNVRWAGGLLSPRTVLIIASDGWERGDPERLAREMAVLSRRVYCVIWLNPLKGRAGYEPLAAGMSVALPYVDTFLPANSLASLERLQRTLARMG